MTKRNILCFLLGTFLSFGGIGSAQALFFGVDVPTIDGVTDALFGTEIVGSTMSNVNTGLIMEVQGNIQDIKAKYKEYANDYEGVMLKDKAPLEGTRTITSSEKSDIKDPSTTKRAVYDLFLAAPSNDFYEQRDYQAQSIRFYQDTLIEVNTAVNRLEQEYNDNLKEKIANMSDDLLSGENGAEVGDDENGSWKNNYNAYKTFDDLVQIWEELVALKAQLTVAKAIKDDIAPAKPAESDAPLKSGDNTQSLTTSQAEDTSSTKPQHYAFNSQLHTETLAFAQQSTGTYRYNPETDSSITFVDAPTPDIDSPFAGSRNELKDLERLNPIYNTAVKGMKIHNLIQSLPSKKALFDQYHQYEKLHEKAVAKVKESDNCALRYLSKYYQNPEQTWYGAYIGEQVTDYDLRKGVSGWAISSYDTAKAALSNPIDSEDLAEMELDASLDGTKYENIASQKSYVEDQSASFDGYKEQSQYDTNEANTRIEELLPWNIGAEAAKELADDQYSGSPQWGTPKTLFPVWNDQKSFYGQYLNGKYANMKNYLSRFDFRNRIVLVAQILNSLSDARLELKQYAAKVLSSMASATSDIVEYPSDGNPDITSAAEEKKAAIETLQKNLEAALQAQEQSRAALVKQLDSAQTRQDELNRQINRAQNANMNEDAKLPEDVDVASLQQEVDAQDKTIEDLQSQIDKIDEKISNLRKAYVQKEQNIEQQYASFVVNIKDPELKKLIVGALSGADIPSGMTADLLAQAQGYVAGLVSTSEGIFSDVKDYAQEAVDQALQDIYGYGDIIYFPSGESQILARHIQLINELKQLPFAKLSQSKPSVNAIASSAEALNLVTTAFQSALVDVICLNQLCENPDSDYFVGASARFRDFSAPKGAPATTTAPVREIVHLDYIDYENIPQLSDGSVAKADILKYGQPVPEVWKYMLKNPAYVEKDIDLESALNLGGEDRNFMRGGFLPCRDDSMLIDAVDDKAGYYVVPDTHSSYLSCLFLKVSSGLLSGRKVTNSEAEKDQTVSAESKSKISNDSFSELGTFFKYENDKLYFREMPAKAYKRLAEIHGDTTTEEYKENVEDNIYKKAAFSDNQIGNFLRFVDMEQEYRQILEELTTKMEQTKADLFEEFKEAGFTPSDDFDLSNPEDYQQARDTLDAQKNNQINAAQNMLQTLTSPENDVVKDRRTGVENMINALIKDENELINLSEDTVPDSTFDERLKTEEANKAIADKYQAEADKAFEDALNSFPAPYCAAY